MTEYKIHPLADLFPKMSAEEFEKLKHDIEQHGLHEPIRLSADGKTLLDGRHRLRACRELDIEPDTERMSLHAGVGYGVGNPETDYIWARNVLRRHLTEDQRAAIAMQWSDAERDAAKQRQKAGVKPLGESAQTPRTREVIAKKAQVSTHKIRQAEEVAKRAPEVLPKVAAGEMKLKDATQRCKEDHRATWVFDEQAALTRLYRQWEVSIEKHWPKERGLGLVISRLRQYANYLEMMQKKNDAEKAKQEVVLEAARRQIAQYRETGMP